jgi:TfoX/Sxy family transcriptional regulator of competence genes
MGSDLSFVQHVCDQLANVPGVTYRKMFGEFALYAGGKVVALVCDNRLFVRPTDAGRELLTSPTYGAPYPGAKPHIVADDYLDDRDLLTALVQTTAAALPLPKPKLKSRSKRGRR